MKLLKPYTIVFMEVKMGTRECYTCKHFPFILVLFDCGWYCMETRDGLSKHDMNKNNDCKFYEKKKYMFWYKGRTNERKANNI